MFKVVAKMTGYYTLYRKLINRLREWPDSRRNEFAMEFRGKRLAWGQIAERLSRAKHHADVKALVKRAAEVGLIGKNKGGENDG